MVFSHLLKTIEAFNARVAIGHCEKRLCTAIALVLQDWAANWGNDKRMKSLLNRSWRKFYHEIDEYVVPLHCLLQCIEQREALGECTSYSYCFVRKLQAPAYLFSPGASNKCLIASSCSATKRHGASRVWSRQGLPVIAC
jgi:hypothetical protein